MANQHKHKQRVVRGIDDQLTAEFDAATQAMGSDRSAITRQLWEHYLKRSGAPLPEMRDRDLFNRALEILSRPGVSDADPNELNNHLSIVDTRKQASAVTDGLAKLRSDAQLTDVQDATLKLAMRRIAELDEPTP